MIFHPRLFGRAKIKVDALTYDGLCSDAGTDAIGDAMHKMDPLSVCNSA